MPHFAVENFRAETKGSELTHEHFVSEQWRDGERVWVRPSNPRQFGTSLH